MNDLFTLFTARLDAAGIGYVVTGSVASMVYGEPRLTHDVDLVVDLAEASVSAFVAAFPAHEFYCAPAEVIRLELARPQRGHFNVIHHDTGFKADVYLVGRDPLHRWALAHARALTLGAATLNVAPPEYVIVRKLEFFREGSSERHLHDIRGMLRHSGDLVDAELLARLVAERGLGDVWAKVGAG